MHHFMLSIWVYLARTQSFLSNKELRHIRKASLYMQNTCSFHRARMISLQFALLPLAPNQTATLPNSRSEPRSALFLRAFRSIICVETAAVRVADRKISSRPGLAAGYSTVRDGALVKLIRIYYYPPGGVKRRLASDTSTGWGLRMSPLAPARCACT